jgi:hypothetical protein
VRGVRNDQEISIIDATASGRSRAQEYRSVRGGRGGPMGGN